MATLTGTQLAFLERATVYGIATTLRGDGSPQSTVVWVDVVDGLPSFNTTLTRVKRANLGRDARASLLAVEQDDFYRWLSIDGGVELVSDGAEEQIDKLSRKYDGKPWSYREGERRISVWITPQHVTAYGVD